MQLHRLGVLAVVALLPSCARRVQATENRAPGVFESEIVIGMTAAMSGNAAVLGTETYRGARAWIEDVNAKGGVSGRQIKLVVRDDAYDPPRTVANVQSLLVDDGVFALFGFVGTPTSVKAVPLLERARVPGVGFFTGAEVLRNPQREWAFHVRDSYYAEAETATAYFVDRLHLSRIAVLYQEDPFGQAVLSGIQLALQRRSQSPVATASFARGSTALEGARDKLMASKPEVVAMVGTYGPLARFVKIAGGGGHTWFQTVSFVGSEAFADELIRTQHVNPETYDHVLVTQVVPSPVSDEYSGLSEFRSLLAKSFPTDRPNYVALEGFVDARVLTGALERAGRTLDRDSFARALEGMKNLDVGIGRNVSYAPNNHVALAGVYLSRLGTDGIFRTFTP